ncbi:MAG: hypothetical protein NTV32_06585 [Gammaproteobacteria bacterium]|nr:hypothetical protein [Gammaproteobacteria bacterium]
MVYPLQSDDHGQHYTLMPNAEALSLWWGNNTSQSLILGTVNSTESPHLTQQDTYQNAYWQDDSGNRVGFINEGKYDPTQKTGRKTAHILETPSYHPDGSSNYLRMGDAVQNDGAYSSQAGEPGILAVTEGNYHETHHGGLMELMGNMGTDQDNPVPALRQRVQLNPSFGTPHILKTVSAHLHTADLTSDQVTENKTLDGDTLTHTLTSPDYFVTHGQDETRSIYVNQSHKQTGQSNVININTHALFTTAQERTLKQTGDQRTDQYQNKTLNLNHPENNLQYETLTQNTKSLNKQTTTEVSSIQNYTRTHQQSTQQASQITQQNNSMQSNVGKTYFGDMMHLESGSGSPLPPDSAIMQNDAAMQNIQDEQEQKKKEIVFLLDDPDQLTQGKLRLWVNQQKPMALPLNIPCIYSLDTTQKQGAIELLRRNEEGDRISLATFHPQVRNINVQYKAPPETQIPQSWFTPSGKLPAYMGVQKVAGVSGLDVNDSDINVVMLAVDAAPPQECQITGGYQVKAMSDETVSWLMQSLYTVNKTLPRAADDSTEASGWHWEAPSISDIGLVFKDGVNALVVKDNRQFLMEFLHGGKFHIKEVKGQWMLVFYGKAGLRKWVAGTTYSLEGEASEKNKIRIFKTYAKLMDNQNRFNKVAILAEDAADDSPLAIIVIAPLDTVQYFLDKDPNKQISDLFVNIGIDVVNAAVAGAIVGLFVVLLPLEVGAGIIVLGGVAATAVVGYLLHAAESRVGLINVLIGFGRKVENHYIAQGDRLQIDFETFSDCSATALTKVESISGAAIIVSETMSKVP